MTIDVNNPPSSPDSELDSDMSLAKSMILQGNVVKTIAPGDFVDVDPAVFNPDPLWGYSFQVISEPDNAANQVEILVKTGGVYVSCWLDCLAVTNNYRRVP